MMFESELSLADVAGAASAFAPRAAAAAKVAAKDVPQQPVQEDVCSAEQALAHLQNFSHRILEGGTPLEA
jgi:hypothetical protein